MTDSIVESFDALAALVQDDVWSAQFKKRVASALNAKDGDRAAMLAAAYLDAEREVLRHSEAGMNEGVLRAKFSAEFAKVADRYPGLPILMLASERQFLAIANALIAAYGEAWMRVAGRELVERAMSRAWTDTPWMHNAVSLTDGIKPDPVRMRTLGDICDAASRLFEGWYGAATPLIGEDANRAAFENAYLRLKPRLGYLPAFKNLLGTTPIDVLTGEKAARLHDLERETTAQARDIRVAGQDLRSQAEELRRTVVELEETKRKLEIVSKARSEFIDVVSHQFRTPLSSIRWNSELMVDAAAEAKFAPEHRESLENIRTKSVYLIDTLDRVFATLDIDTGSLVLDIKPGFFWEVVQDAYESYRKDIERKGLRWKFNRSKEEPTEVAFDKGKMTSALHIVIGNAINYSKEGDKISVEIGTKRVNGLDYQFCTVTDTGLGLEKGEQERIVEKFFRSKAAVLKAPDGTGLGMYIVKRYVEAHRGQLEIESEGLGKGTSVTIALPLQ